MHLTDTSALALFLFGLLVFLGCQSSPAPLDNAAVEAEIDALLAEMTLEEKIGMIHASSSFTSGGVERLGIPELIMSDGPHGVRHEHGRDWEKDEGVADSSTYLPVGVALASTWNRDLGYQFGSVLGQEANFRGKDVILGPGLNIIRSPLNGRNFEYLTEDPYLNGQMVIGYVRGVQDQGVAANAVHRHAGAGGSSQVKAYYEVTPLEGLQNLLGGDVSISHAPGYRIEPEGAADAQLIQEAVDLVSSADAAIYVGGLFHGYSDEWNDNAFDAEVLDKPDMMLPFGQDELINAVLEANPKTIIVLVGGAPVDMRAWSAEAKGIVQAWYAGMEGGNALADILFGNVNPSGKLPMTFPQRLEDSGAHALAQYPDENLLIDHTDGIYVGYRYFDTYDVEPAFAFGHGLSYTTSDFSDLEVEKQGNRVNVRVTVTNSGDRAGAEVVQVYVHDQEASVDRPTKELKNFQKVFLNPGDSETVEMSLDESAFSFFDEDQMAWVLEPGTFTIQVGSSSRDIRLEADIAW